MISVLLKCEQLARAKEKYYANYSTSLYWTQMLLHSGLTASETWRLLEKTKTIKAFNKVLGNDSWTVLLCSACDKDSKAVAVFDKGEDYVQFCEECVLRMKGVFY